MNCLFACNFALKFIYALTGWDGSATDALLWQDAPQKGLVIPEGKYFLGDAGFSLKFLHHIVAFNITWQNGGVHN